jgi:hypothetical protein
MSKRISVSSLYSLYSNISIENKCEELKVDKSYVKNTVDDKNVLDTEVLDTEVLDTGVLDTNVLDILDCYKYDCKKEIQKTFNHVVFKLPLNNNQELYLKEQWRNQLEETTPPGATAKDTKVKTKNNKFWNFNRKLKN